MTLRRHLVSLVLVTLLPVLTFAAIMVVRVVRHEQAAVERGMRETARALSLAVDRELEVSITALQALATSASLDAGDLTAFYGAAARVRAEVHPTWSSVGLIEPSGRRLLALPAPLGTPLPRSDDREYFQQVLKSRRPAISDLLFGRPSGEPVVAIAVPVLRDGQLRYVLIAEISSANWSALLAEQRLPDGWAARVLDRQQVTLARAPADPRAIGQPPAGEFDAQSRGRAEGWVRFQTLRGYPAYGAFRRSPVSGWSVALAIPAAAVEGSLRRSLWLTAGGGLLFVALGVGLAAVLGQRLARPIAALSASARALGRGEAPPALPASRVDEVDALGRAIQTAGAARLDAEAALRQSEARWLTTLHSIGDAVIATDAEGRVTFLNPVAESITGWTAAEASGAPIETVFRVVDEETAGPVENPLAGVFREGKVVGLGNHTVLIDRTGRAIPIDDSGAPIRDAGGRIVGAVLVFRDIAERRHADEIVRETTQLLDALIRSSSLAIVVLEPDATVRLWNPAAERIFGWTAEEAIGGPLPIIPPENWAEFRANLEVSLAGGLFEAEVRRRRKDGSPVDLNVSSAPLRDGGGRLRGVVTIVADVSQRKREQAERERLVALLMDAERRRLHDAERDRREVDVLAGLAREVTASLDVDTVLRRVAEAAKELCDGDSALIAIGAGTASRRYAAGAPEAGAVSGRGEAAPRLTVPIKSGERVEGMLAVERQATEAFTGREERLLLRLADHAAIALRNAQLYQEAERGWKEAEVLAALAGSIGGAQDLDEILQRVVEGARELTGSDLAHIALMESGSGAMVFRYWAGDRQHGTQGYRVTPGQGIGGQVLLTGRPFRTDDYAADLRISGDFLPTVRAEGIVASLAVPILIDGRVEGLLFVDNRAPRPFTDRDEALLARLADHAAVAIRGVQLLGRAQEARAEAEAGSQAKDEFLAMLGHELRNPLGAIANAMLVLERISKHDERAARLRAIVSRQTHHLSRLVDDLLDVTRLSTGKIQIRRVATDLRAVAERGLASLHEAGKTSRHTVQLAGEPVLVAGDPTRLEQVVWNLLDNALKYTPPGGRIDVSVDREGPEAVLRVRDSGAGIAAGMLPRIFDLFVQAPASLDRSQGGLGLGLTLVRRLVELHGGQVAAASAGPGQGSEFVVRLPALAAAAAGEAATATLTPAAVPRRVLLVEDNADVREGLRLLLEEWGHRVEEAADGPSGVVRALDVRPDVALVDVGLPGIDGYAVARQIREAPGGGEIRLVALTGYGQPEDRRRALDAGFDAHLVKPVDPDDLLRLLNG